MKDPIIDAIRKIRDQYAIDYKRDPIGTMEKTRRRVLDLATDIEWYPDGSFRANFRIPEREFQERLAKEREMQRDPSEEVLF